jgi:hypothetical protein
MLSKKSCYSLLILFVFLGCFENNDSSSSDSNNKVTGFYYSFDESGSTIIDYSGNNYNASANNISRVTGKVGKAIQFLAEGSEIVLPIISDYFPFKNGFTFRVWLKFDAAVTSRQQIIGGMSGHPSWYPISNFGISIVNDEISFEVPSDPNMMSFTSSSLNIVPNEWFHIAISYNGDELKFYHNGSLIGTTSILTTFDNYFQNQIGYNYIVFSGITIYDQFYGYIDELYLENKILTVSEISNYYNSTK